jgi:hypothetical protein
MEEVVFVGAKSVGRITNAVGNFQFLAVPGELGCLPEGSIFGWRTARAVRSQTVYPFRH